MPPTEDQLYKQFKLERLGTGDMFLEAICQKCGTKFAIHLDQESIKERLEEHVNTCRVLPVPKNQ